MHAVHTPADPPNQGKMALAAIGCKRNISAELRKIAGAYVQLGSFRRMTIDAHDYTSQAPVQGG
jgi:hypothetical protein